MERYVKNVFLVGLVVVILFLVVVVYFMCEQVVLNFDLVSLSVDEKIVFCGEICVYFLDNFEVIFEVVDIVEFCQVEV